MAEYDVPHLLPLLLQKQFGTHPRTKVPLWELWDPPDTEGLQRSLTHPCLR